MSLQRASGLLAVLVLVLVGIPASAGAQSSTSLFEGMWSDPPTTIEGMMCLFGCTDSGLELLYEKLDDPANDDVPLEQLMLKTYLEDLDNVLVPYLTEFSRPGYPLDQSLRNDFLKCEPPGFADQLFMPHQFSISAQDGVIDLHYGEWDAHRTVHMDQQVIPADEPDSLMGYSIGRMEGDTLVVHTSKVKAGIVWVMFNHSNALQAEERFTRSDDGEVLTATITLTDPVAMTRPFVMKRIWYWAPTETIDPYEDCQIPTDYLEHKEELR